MDELTHRILYTANDWALESTVIQRTSSLKRYTRPMVKEAIQAAISAGLLEYKEKVHPVTHKAFYMFKSVNTVEPFKPKSRYY